MALDWLDDAMRSWEAQGLRRRLRTVDGVGGRVRVDGREALLLCSNAYLGLQWHPEVVRAAQEAARAHGAGTGASRLVSGTTPEHMALERDLAAFKGTEDAVVFATGYMANVGTLPALVGPGDLVLSDRLNHASVIDACRLSRAAVEVYGHGDVTDLARRLEALRPKARRCLVVTDGVFSMDGDEAPLRDIARRCAQHDAGLFVDDAHGTGVLGPEGRGTAAAQEVVVDVQMGTLSKALGAEGGFVAGSRALCEHLRNHARAFVFSTAPAPAVVGAARAALRVLRREPGLRARLAANAGALRDGLREAGLEVPAGRTPIVPIHVGAADAAMRVMARLEDAGVYAAAIRPPTVPAGTSRIRATTLAVHTDADIQQAVAALAAAAGAEAPRSVAA